MKATAVSLLALFETKMQLEPSGPRVVNRQVGGVDGGRNPRKSGGTFFSGIKNAVRER
jgi:hypothetical protein